jgi:circadian clock protein KaiC
LRIHATRPTAAGLESHLATVYNEIQEFKPTVVVIDPITNLRAVFLPRTLVHSGRQVRA